MIVNPAARKYGVYIVDGKEFLLKSDAFDYAKHDKSKINYSMFGVSELDLDQDPFPGIGIKELYRIRAQELRDQYDYLVLNLSGGPDSMNILDVFMENNIPIDEIINHNSLSKTGVVDGSNNNADYVYNVKPKLDELQKLPGFKTKISIIDEIDSVQHRLNNIYQIGNEELLWEVGGPNRPTSVGGQSIQYVEHLWKMIRDGVNVGVISGVDKPIARIVNGRKFLVYADNLRGQFVEFITDNQVAPFWEWFYQGDIRIAHKQCYLLEQFVKHHTDAGFYEPFDQLANTEFRPAQHWPSHDASKNLKYEPFHNVLYPGLKQSFVTPKDANLWLRPRDNWWMSKIDDKLKSLYSKSIIKWRQKSQLKTAHEMPVFSDKIQLK